MLTRPLTRGRVSAGKTYNMQTEQAMTHYNATVDNAEQQQDAGVRISYSAVADARGAILAQTARVRARARERKKICCCYWEGDSVHNGGHAVMTM